MHQLSSVLIHLLTLKNLLAMFGGIFAGLIVGALPGFQANMGVALLLPLTYGMGPDTGLLMLCSLYAAAIYGGSLTAILFSTPGTTASAASAIEGFELTKQGKAGTAIRVATWSSCIGGLLGAFSLLFISPPLSLLSLKFGPLEYFLLAVFGLATISSIASGSTVKGLIAGSLGFLFSTFGMDINSGFPRFVFHLPILVSGIPFVPAVIGLFAMSQVLNMVEKSLGNVGSGIAAYDKNDWSFFLSRDLFRQIRIPIIRSYLIGLIMGVLPGAGADVASWVSYQQAKRFSKNPEKFGHGAIDGLASAEVAKNSDTGGALIPLFTLGIPGSSTAAILLGALVMNGLVPGRELFTKYGQITYTVILGFIFANILMGVIGLWVARYFARLTNINTAILAPMIATLTVVGSFALGNDINDVWIMLIFGIIGYFMQKRGFHPAAMVLGLILGPMAETGYRQSLILAKGSLLTYFIGRPISIILLGLIIVSLFGPMLFGKIKVALFHKLAR